MRNILAIIALISIILSCKQKNKGTEIPNFMEKEEKVEMKYYDQNFQLDSLSNLRTDGYYLVKEIFGTYTTNGSDYKTSNAKYGFVHFFNDGYCRIGSWNGIRKNPEDVEKAFYHEKGYIFNGLYQIQSDTLKVEYLYNPASPGAGQSDNRYTLTGLIKTNRIEFITDTYRRFSYPTNPSDSLTSSCIGKFVKGNFDQSKWTNYLKQDILKYTRSAKKNSIQQNL